jgi:hypothetical protein
VAEVALFEVGQTVTETTASAIFDSVPNDGKVYMYVNTPAGAPVEMRVVARRDCNARHGELAGELVDWVQMLDAGGTTMVGPWEPYFYNQDPGVMAVKFTPNTGVVFFAMHFPGLNR